MVLHRRAFLKSAATIGISSTVGCLDGVGYLEGANETLSPEEVEAHLEAYSNYLREITDSENVDLSLPIGVGEQHKPTNDMFRTLGLLVDEFEPDIVGLESLDIYSPEVERFNDNSPGVTSQDLAKHYQSNTVSDRDLDTLISFFEKCKENETRIEGLNPDINYYKHPQISAEFMADAAIELYKESNGSIIFGVGSAHLEPKMFGPYANIMALQLEESSISPGEIKKDPLKVWDLAEKEDLVNRQIGFYSEKPEIYTLNGRIDDLESIHSTSAPEQEHMLKRARDMVPSDIENHGPVEAVFIDIEALVSEVDERCTSQGPYRSTTSRNYYVAVESGPDGF